MWNTEEIKMENGNWPWKLELEKRLKWIPFDFEQLSHQGTPLYCLRRFHDCQMSMSRGILLASALELKEKPWSCPVSALLSEFWRLSLGRRGFKIGFEVGEELGTFGARQFVSIPHASSLELWKTSGQWMLCSTIFQLLAQKMITSADILDSLGLKFRDILM